MKKTLLLLATAAGLLLASSASAQTPISNGTLETWVTRNGYEALQDWLTTDDILTALGFPLGPTGTVVKSTDKHAGTYAAQIRNASLLGFSLPGVIGLGSTSGPAGPVDGVPYTSRAARLQFWYKLSGPNAVADSAGVFAALTRNGVEVASTTQYLAPQATYTLVDVPLTYSSGLTPDTLHLGASSGFAETVSTTTTLLIDDIQLVGTVMASKDAAATAALQIYPNPSTTGEFSLASLADATTATAPYRVTDATGRLVRAEGAAPASAARGRLVDLRGLPGGVYLLQLSAPAGPITRKLVIR